MAHMEAVLSALVSRWSPLLCAAAVFWVLYPGIPLAE